MIHHRVAVDIDSDTDIAHCEHQPQHWHHSLYHNIQNILNHIIESKLFCKLHKKLFHSFYLIEPSSYFMNSFIEYGFTLL